MKRAQSLNLTYLVPAQALPLGLPSFSSLSPKPDGRQAPDARSGTLGKVTGKGSEAAASTNMNRDDGSSTASGFVSSFQDSVLRGGQASLKVAIFLPLPSQHWDHRCA